MRSKSQKASARSPAGKNGSVVIDPVADIGAGGDDSLVACDRLGQLVDPAPEDPVSHLSVTRILADVEKSPG